jgi:DivIVA domain-containing protein
VLGRGHPGHDRLRGDHPSDRRIPSVPLDRQAIEKRDFPIGRRGYDPAAVDTHLARLADEIEALHRQAKRRSGESLAQSASEQVRAIVQAAEASAEAIEQEAEQEAQQIRSEAVRDAERTRGDAIERAQGHVGRVSEATRQMLQRVEGMQSELSPLVESLRTGANRVNADLSLLEVQMVELHSAAAGERSDGGPSPLHEPSLPPGPPEASITHPEDDLERTPEVEAFDTRSIDVEPEQPVASEAVEEDVEGARLIALNMALSGQSRAETDQYLAENFSLRDRARLLDEVYESIGA